MELSVHGKTIRKIFLLTDRLHYQDGLKETKSNREPVKTDFDKSLLSGWQDKSSALKYDVESCVQTRRVGDYILQLNPDRAKTRRPPDAMENVTEPFNNDKFNFTKINFEKESVFELRTDEETDADHVIINLSPVEVGHSLMVPNLWEKQPQIVTERSVLVALKTVMASGLPNFKAAFNSLCGHASVNHLHWHFYYLRDPYRLPVEALKGKPIGYGCYSLEDDYSAPGFAFQISQVKKLEDLSKRVHTVAKLFCDLNVAHNIFVTKGTPLDSSTKKTKVIKVFIWPRRNVSGAKNLLELGWTVAVCELAGHILVYDEEKYNQITEKDIVDAHRLACQEPFLQVKDKVLEALSVLGDLEQDETEQHMEVDLASSDGENGSMVGSQYNTETEDTADEGDVVTDLLIDGDDESAADVTTGAGESSSVGILERLRANREQLLNDLSNDSNDPELTENDKSKESGKSAGLVEGGGSDATPATSSQNGSDPEKVKSEMKIQSGNQSADSNNDDCVVLSD